MDKRTYFLKALHAGAFKYKHWQYAMFSKVELNDENNKYDYDYRLVMTDTGYAFIDPENNREPTTLTGADVNLAPFAFKEKVSLKAGDIPNVFSDITTTYGNLFCNYLILVYPFGNKIPFLEGKLSVPRIEKLIEDRLESDVGPGEQEDPNKIYVHEYLRYGEAIFSLTGVASISVPSASPKTMTRDPRIPEIRRKELEANKDRLHDPAVIARIDKKLEAIDREWVDDWGKNFYIKDKAYNNTRKKAYSMHGFEKGFVEDAPSVLIENALVDGWDMTKLPAMFNSSREGSFNRGALTMLGGVAVKEAFRAIQNSRVTEKDCGSTLGIPRLITQENAPRMVGFYHLVNNKPVAITKENVSSLIGKEISLRSSMLCKTPFTDFCETCVGSTTARNPTGLGALVAGVGSTFMGAFMKKMHVSSLKLAEYDYRSTIS